MKQKQSDKFIRLYKAYTETICWDRAEKCAKHLLTAVAFKEISIISYKNTNSVLLTPIGYYYSIYHLSLSMCWLHPEIPETDLSRIRHSTLQNFISSFFVNQKLIGESFLILFKKLKEEREYLNYDFGEYENFSDFFQNTEDNTKLICQEFDNSFILMNEICKILKPKFDIKQRIRTYIADSKGDDLLQTYLNDKEQDIVMDYIVAKDFSN
jgi:hypothetical protein